MLAGYNCFDYSEKKHRSDFITNQDIRVDYSGISSRFADIHNHIYNTKFTIFTICNTKFRN